MQCNIRVICEGEFLDHLANYPGRVKEYFLPRKDQEQENHLSVGDLKPYDKDKNRTTKLTVEEMQVFNRDNGMTIRTGGEKKRKNHKWDTEPL